MSSIGTVSRLLERLKEGEAEAARLLWESYYHRLVSLARTRLRAVPRRAADEEDVVLSAFDSFCRAAEAGRFPRLDDRQDLWQVLLLLVSRKAADLRAHEASQKRGGGRVHNVSALGGDVSGEGAGELEVQAREPDPAETLAVADEVRRLLAKLGDEELCQVAVAKLEGHSNAEIAGRYGWSMATVERKLRLIRRVWQAEVR